MSPSPILQLDEAVARAAFAAAPEKAEDLFARARHIKLNFVCEPHKQAGCFEFSASLRSGVIKQAHFSIFGVNHTIDHDAPFGRLLDGLCVDLTRHRF